MRKQCDLWRESRRCFAMELRVSVRWKDRLVREKKTQLIQRLRLLLARRCDSGKR